MTESEEHRIIKYAVAKGLVEIGYMAGVEVPRPGAAFSTSMAGKEIARLRLKY